MKRKYRQNGSALVLVLIASLFLITLSTITLSLSLTNTRMASKVQNSNSEFYFLEKLSQGAIIDLDKKLAECEGLALKYMDNEVYKSNTVSDANKYLKEKLADENNHELFHAMWKTSVLEPSKQDGTINDAIYSQNMNTYFQEAYNRLYYSYVTKALEHYRANDGTDNGYDTSNAKYYEGYYTAEIKNTTANSFATFKNSGSEATNQITWNNFQLKPNVLNLELDVYGTNVKDGAQQLSLTPSGSGIEGRKITGLVSIVPPVYGGKESTLMTKYQVNPVYTNSITAGGSITFNSGTHNINGEISARSNINILSGGNVNIAGNVCSGETLTINGNGNLTIKDFTSSSDALKKSAFRGKDTFYDADRNEIVSIAISSPRIHQVIEDSLNPAEKCMPFILNDAKGGNLYTYGVSFKNALSGSALTSRNIYFKNSFQNTGSVKPNVSINNIAISVTKNANVNNLFTPKFGCINSSYIYPQDNNYYWTDGNADLYFTNNGTTASENGSFSTILKARTRQFGTYNFTSVASMVVEGYLQKDALAAADSKKISQFNEAEDASWESLDTLKYVKGNTTLDLKGKTLKGIIYCDGDLTIKNSGTGGGIEGSIVCKKSVTVDNNVKINYNEANIIATLEKSKPTRDFFRACKMGDVFNLNIQGDDADKEVIENTSIRVRKSKDRYNIIKWSRTKVR